MSDKKKLQLGMNPSTASGRLVKDILFKLICETKKNICHRCHTEMSRDTFSIEHKLAWLDAEDPITVFFDLENITFSHLSCNISQHRTPLKKYNTDDERRMAKNSMERKQWGELPKEQQRKRRREKYIKHKC